MVFTKTDFHPLAHPPPLRQVAGRRIPTSCYTRVRLWCSLLLACFFLSIATAPLYAQSCPPYPSPHLRIGYNVTRDGNVDITDYAATQLGAGWYHDYSMRAAPPQPGGIAHHQMIRASGRTTPDSIQQILPSIGRIVDASPGDFWILGNEPDRHGQDGLTPSQYARFYHDTYYFIKHRDPSSRLAIAGIVQPTKLRLRYLDMVLSAYEQQYGEKMPVDIWDIHNFILPENCGWGAGIPPGLEAYANEGTLCPATLAAHGNIETFKQQIRAFRQWMKDRGYQDRPLVISEYGILLSQYHGFPYSTVRNYMLASFDFMLNTKDNAIGYPADDYRLVQEFAWFSLNYYEFDLATYVGLNGNLFDHGSRQIKPLGLDFANYTSQITIRTTDLALKSFQATPGTVNGGEPVTLQAALVNSGGVAAEGVTVRFYDGDPRTQGQLLGASSTINQILPGCQQTQNVSFVWTPLQAGVYSLFAELVATNQSLEIDPANNYVSQAVTVLTSAPATPTPTPTLVTPVNTPTATSTLAPGEPTYTPTATLAATEPTYTPTPTLLPGEPTYTPTPTATLVPGAPAPTPTGTTTPVAQGGSGKKWLYLPIINR
ncbi:MAG: hypothetical protein DYG89_00350 [Caldilinea sp. CFX5]|nr:hypothetical protein [Caldilinea sp. CFX5]